MAATTQVRLLVWTFLPLRHSSISWVCSLEKTQEANLHFKDAWSERSKAVAQRAIPKFLVQEAWIQSAAASFFLRC